MKIRARLTLWYSGILLASMFLMLGVLYYELVVERQAGGVPEEMPEQIIEILLFYGVPTALMLLAGGWWLMRRALAPIVELTRTVEGVHADTLRARIPRSGNGDEVDRLTAVFNDMMARLDNSFAGIRAFTLHASHELKTPLTLLHGEIETLLSDNQCTAAQRDVLSGQLQEIQRMARMVDDLSLLTRANAGSLPLAREPVRLDELIREACEDARILAEPHGITVELGVCQEITVSGERHRLRQLLLNLVDNAVKHNEPNGRVTISLRRESDNAHLEVVNTGPGIASEQLPMVFDPFFRGAEAHRMKRDGCGLGLSIALWIVKAHGGSLEIQSQPGGMTTVRVRMACA